MTVGEPLTAWTLGDAGHRCVFGLFTASGRLHYGFREYNSGRRQRNANSRKPIDGGRSGKREGLMHGGLHGTTEYRADPRAGSALSA